MEERRRYANGFVIRGLALYDDLFILVSLPKRPHQGAQARDFGLQLTNHHGVERDLPHHLCGRQRVIAHCRHCPRPRATHRRAPARHCRGLAPASANEFKPSNAPLGPDVSNRPYSWYCSPRGCFGDPVVRPNFAFFQHGTQASALQQGNALSNATLLRAAPVVATKQSTNTWANASFLRKACKPSGAKVPGDEADAPAWKSEV